MGITSMQGLERYKVLPTTVLSTDPAANTELSATVTAGQLYELYAVNFTLVTDANAANRDVTLIIDDGTNIIAQVTAVPVQAASTTYNYNFAVGNPDRATVTGTNVIAPLPGPFVLPPSARIRTSTANKQAGDNYGAATLFIVRYAR